MIYFDRVILEFFNRFSHRSWMFDKAIILLTQSLILKGGIVIAIFWVLWIVRDKEDAVEATRRTVLATFVGTFVALGFAVVLAVTLPFRFRPLHQQLFNFQLPFGVSKDVLSGWSSFPSDHATLFAGLVTGIFLISRRLGFFSIIYVFLVILIPRIYLGYHYPTDILGGVLIGCVSVLVTNGTMIKKLLTDPLYEWSEKYPHFFHGVFFLVYFEMAVLFEDIRTLGAGLKAIVHRFF